MKDATSRRARPSSPGKHKGKYQTLRWFSVNEPLTNEPSLRLKFLRRAFFGEHEKFLALWKSFAAATLDNWGKANGSVHARRQGAGRADYERGAGRPLAPVPLQSGMVFHRTAFAHLLGAAECAGLRRRRSGPGSAWFYQPGQVVVAFCEELGLAPSLDTGYCTRSPLCQTEVADWPSRC